ncbi:hypothetical protein ICW40_07475 [Actinotalea ferrariae]|uniref:hypothetical protein n=1 Tax=Actinotalea ferrariae TaxID=1386098 RepID=UPI001C8B4230|nr:hypothetical protein [Actinotalea ferrariae]MBX9244649.1 hypothetical protein [Actinotalea ferrariae]
MTVDDVALEVRCAKNCERCNRQATARAGGRKGWGLPEGMTDAEISVALKLGHERGIAGITQTELVLLDQLRTLTEARMRDVVDELRAQDARGRMSAGCSG